MKVQIKKTGEVVDIKPYYVESDDDYAYQGDNGEIYHIQDFEIYYETPEDRQISLQYSHWWLKNNLPSLMFNSKPLPLAIEDFLKDYVEAMKKI